MMTEFVEREEVAASIARFTHARVGRARLQSCSLSIAAAVNLTTELQRSKPRTHLAPPAHSTAPPPTLDRTRPLS